MGFATKQKERILNYKKIMNKEKEEKLKENMKRINSCILSIVGSYPDNDIVFYPKNDSWFYFTIDEQEFIIYFSGEPVQLKKHCVCGNEFWSESCFNPHQILGEFEKEELCMECKKANNEVELSFWKRIWKCLNI